MTRMQLLLVFLTVLVAGCSFLPSATPSAKDAALRELTARQARWQSQGLDDYAIWIDRSCFCPPQSPIKVVVQDGAVVGITRDGQPVAANEIQGIPRTVPELFALIAAQTAAGSLTVAYDATFGYPKSIQVDPIANAVDDEFSISVTNFQPAS